MTKLQTRVSKSHSGLLFLRDKYVGKDSIAHILSFSKIISSVTSAKSLSLTVAIFLKNSLASFYSINCLARL